jgi:hypothetical protein
MDDDPIHDLAIVDSEIAAIVSNDDLIAD